MAHEVDSKDADNREVEFENGRPVTKDDDEDSEDCECHA